MTTGPLLQIEHLSIDVPAAGKGRRVLLRDVSLQINAGQGVGLVGESGSGKSLTARAVIGLTPPGAHVTGSVRFEDTEVLTASPRDIRRLRAKSVAMMFQDPRAHINPVRTVGDHVMESLRYVDGLSRASARTRAVELLEAVQFDAPERLLKRYPHELSGGMLQRVMIAGALAGSPNLLLADEATTALDVTIQAEVMAIIGQLRRDRGLAVLLITHDLELAAATSDRTIVMYAGSVVETRPSSAVLSRPRHPYSAALGRSRPALDRRVHRLAAIGGQPIAAFEAPDGCSFADRCPFVLDRCRSDTIPLRPVSDGLAACVRAEEIEAQLVDTVST